MTKIQNPKQLSSIENGSLTYFKYGNVLVIGN
jgi:hypothetical protein